MSLFFNEYKKRFTLEFQNMGFKVYKNRCYRIINDLYQAFEINLYKGKECDVNYGIIPICAIITSNHDSVCGLRYELSWKHDRFRWNYNNNVESINYCIDQVIKYIYDYIIPVMNKSTDAESALECIYSLDKAHFNEILQFDEVKYFMFLKLGNFKEALKILNNKRNQIIESLVSNLSAGYKDNDVDFILNIVKKSIPLFNEIEEKINELKTSDESVISQTILNNEKLTLENLKWSKL